MNYPNTPDSFLQYFVYTLTEKYIYFYAYIISVCLSIYLSVFLSIYVYIYIYIYIYIYVYIYISITYIYVHVYKYVFMKVDIYINICIIIKKLNFFTSSVNLVKWKRIFWLWSVKHSIDKAQIKLRKGYKS